MNILDRKKEPEFKVFDKIDIVKADKRVLSNGITVYSINAGNYDLVKIDLIFEAGDWYQIFPMLANSTISMLCEGSLFRTAEEIAEKLDFFGSYIYYNTQKHTSTITIYSLTKYLDETLQLIQEVIKYPLFPEKEFETFNNKRKQQFIIDNQKVEILAQKHFSRSLFGKKHPYGMYPDVEDFDKINTSNIRSFHAKYYCCENCKIIISGKIENGYYDLLNRHFGDIDWSKTQTSETMDKAFEPASNNHIYIEKKDALQSAIRIGKTTINKYHSDFNKLQIVNTILGGYFGSRLMSNIREDKGFTYGIGSGLISNKSAGYFVIATEVGKPYKEKALIEIYNEIKRIQTEKAPDKELEIVKNYMMGNVLRNFDGPFALSDTLKTMLEYDFTYEYYDSFISTIKNITSKQICDTASMYLDAASMYEIVAG